MNKAYKMNQSQSNFSKGALGYSQPPGFSGPTFNAHHFE